MNDPIFIQLGFAVFCIVAILLGKGVNIFLVIMWAILVGILVPALDNGLAAQTIALVLVLFTKYVLKRILLDDAKQTTLANKNHKDVRGN